MIRLRDKDGKAYNVGRNIKFIEICDAGGKLAAVIRANENDVAVFAPGDIEFENYVTAYRERKAVVLTPQRKPV